MTEEPLSISRAAVEDLAATVEILEGARGWLDSKGIHQWVIPFTSEWARGCLEREELYSVKVGDFPVGVFRLLDSDPLFWGEVPPDSVYIHSLAVRRAVKGQSIGYRVLSWIQDYAVREQRTFLRLDCLASNASLCQYYEHFGFRARETKAFQFGDFAYEARLYEKVLALDRLERTR